MAEPMVAVRRVSGLRRVDVPDGPRGVVHGDVVELRESRAARFVAGGEWEYVPEEPAEKEDG